MEVSDFLEMVAKEGPVAILALACRTGLPVPASVQVVAVEGTGGHSVE
jgi:hypothetical protein